jgi:partner of Y14 and mago
VVLHSVRKELKIRPGFTPQEDVNRFRGKRQAMADAMKLPPGHIVGWIPPSTESVSKSKSTSIISNSNTPLTKAALKNAKRKAKRKEAAKTDAVAGAPENWDDEDEEDPSIPSGSTNSREGSAETGAKREGKEEEVEAEALVEKLDDLALS